MSGTVGSTSVNNVCFNYRPNLADYYTTASYLTSGNEALVFASKNAVTSFMFVNGEDSVTNHGSDRWTKITPGIQIKNNKVAINKLIANGVTPTYTLEVAGTGYFSDTLRGANWSIGGTQPSGPIFWFNNGTRV